MKNNEEESDNSKVKEQIIMVTDIYYFSGTHWDREWYQTFQGFRHRLVDMTDELINHLENDEKFGTYHFDGQTIVLEDYKKNSSRK